MITDRELPWTGERLVTSHLGDTAVEHLHRYAFACEYARDKDVLDIACGEGYGAYFLADVARSVVGVDISEEVVAHAQRKYGGNRRLSFRRGSCVEIPLPDDSVDLVSSFETLEHHDEHQRMLEEIKRVLRPGGTLVISTPDRLNCTIIPKNFNPYHFKELFREEFISFLRGFFGNVYFFEQKICHASVITPSAGQSIAEFRHYQGDFRRLIHTKGIAGALFNLAVATDSDERPELNVSLFQGMDIPTDLEKNHSEVVRSNAELQTLLTEKSAQIDWHVQHTKDMEADYRRILAEQDARLEGECAALRTQLKRQDAQIDWHVQHTKDMEADYQRILAEQNAQIDWHVQHTKDMEADYQRILAEQNARLEGECAALRTQLKRQDAQIDWHVQHTKDMEADYQRILAEQDARLTSECIAMRTQLSQEYTALLEKWESACGTFASLERSRSQEIKLLRDEIRSIAASRAWKFAQWVRRCASPIRRLRLLTARAGTLHG